MVRAMPSIRVGLRGAKAPGTSWSSRGTRLQFLTRGLAIACGALVSINNGPQCVQKEYRRNEFMNSIWFLQFLVDH